MKKLWCLAIACLFVACGKPLRVAQSESEGDPISNAASDSGLGGSPNGSVSASSGSVPGSSSSSSPSPGTNSPTIPNWNDPYLANSSPGTNQQASGSGNAIVPSAPAPTAAPAPAHLLFVTTTTYTADLGGLAGADEKCTTFAHANGLRVDRPWIALLSDSKVSASARIQINGDIANINNQTLFPAGNLFAAPPAAPILFENSLAPDATTTVWTNTDAAGAPAVTSFGSPCQEWTSRAAALSAKAGSTLRAAVGKPASANWLNDSTPYCNSSAALYCISQ